MIQYVLGFMFDITLKNVVLIQKNRPTWMKGLFNGVGGKIENNEIPEQSMIREFVEETGLYQSDWVLSHEEFDDSYHMYVFYTVTDNMYAVESTTDEEVKIYSINKLPNNLCPNIKFHIETIKSKNISK